VTVLGVTVSLDGDMSVSEDAATVQVCATLSAIEPTERDFNITVATSDGTGK
jgi:tellurite resistance protein